MDRCIWCPDYGSHRLPRHRPCPEGGRGFLLITDGATVCGMLGAKARRFHHAGWMMSFCPESAGDAVRHIHTVSALVVQADAACRSRAFFRSSGSSLPRTEALRVYPDTPSDSNSIFSGTPACKICDKVDTFSALGNSPVLRIKYPPCETEIICHDLSGGRPPLRSRSMNFVSLDRADLFEDGLEVRTLVGAERAGDVLPYDVSWISAIGFAPHFFYDSDGFVEKAGTGAVQAPPAGLRYSCPGRVSRR